MFVKFILVLAQTFSVKPFFMPAQNLFATAISDVEAVTIRFRPGEDLKAQLDDYVKANHVKAACIITVSAVCNKWL